MRSVARRLFQPLNRRYAVGANVVLLGQVHIGPGTSLWAPTRLTVGADVYLGKRCTVEVDGQIGQGTLLANNVGIVGRRDHDFRQVGVPMTQSRWVGASGNDDLKTSVSIGGDVWVGYGAVILAPVTIGAGAVIAAGSVVIHDVLPLEIVAGNPATHIGWRFEGELANEHSRLLPENDYGSAASSMGAGR